MMETPDIPRLSKEALEYAHRVFDAHTIDAIRKLSERLGCYTASNWLRVPNPNFGNISPLELIMMGRGRKVNEFIINATEGDIP